MTELEQAFVHVDRLRGTVEHVLRHSFHKGGRGNDADDVLQNAKIKIWKKLPGFQHESKLSTWVYRIVLNEAKMEVRNGLGVAPRRKGAFTTTKRRHGRMDSLAESLGENKETDVAFEIPDTTPNPEQLAAEQMILRTVAKLPPGYRKTFELHVLHGYEHAEIAAMTGRSAGNSKSQFYKAKARLQHELSRDN